MAGYSPWDLKESDPSEQLTLLLLKPLCFLLIVNKQ